MQTMKAIISLWLALLTAIPAVLLYGAARAGDADVAAYARGNLQAKIEYCEDCHGSSGRGYFGYLTMPRLAGQNAGYIEAQLRAFVDGRRDRDLFLNMARVHGVSPSMRSALASHFSGANPRPLAGAPAGLVGNGRTIFQDGLPEANIPACAACHGPDGRGQDANPRLAGQLYPYIATRLTNWPKEHANEAASGDTSATMARVIHNLSRAQISAVAAYVSRLR
jgi:cytochrome c553